MDTLFNQPFNQENEIWADESSNVYANCPSRDVSNCACPKPLYVLCLVPNTRRKRFDWAICRTEVILREHEPVLRCRGYLLEDAPDPFGCRKRRNEKVPASFRRPRIFHWQFIFVQHRVINHDLDLRIGPESPKNRLQSSRDYRRRVPSCVLFGCPPKRRTLARVRRQTRR